MEKAFLLSALQNLTFSRFVKHFIQSIEEVSQLEQFALNTCTDVCKGRGSFPPPRIPLNLHALGGPTIISVRAFNFACLFRTSFKRNPKESIVCIAEIASTKTEAGKNDCRQGEEPPGKRAMAWGKTTPEGSKFKNTEPHFFISWDYKKPFSECPQLWELNSMFPIKNNKRVYAMR